MAGRFEDMARSAAELKNLVTKDDLPSWRGHADLFSGLALMRRGEKEEGLVRARRGIKRLLDAHAFSNCWFILFAQACFENGRLDEAAEMLALVRPSLAQGDVRFAAEFHRVDAAVTLARGGSVAQARERLEDALALAKSQEALLFVDRLRRDLDMLPASDSARGAPHETRFATAGPAAH